MSVDIFSENLDDPDDAPPWSEAVFARAEIAIGDVVLRPATGTLTKRGPPKLAFVEPTKKAACDGRPFWSGLRPDPSSDNDPA